jgi:hypothetical protein
MKFKFLRLDLASKSSPISEGVVEIRIDIHLPREKPDNATLKSHEHTMSGNSSRRDQGDDLGPPHPSASLPCDTSTGIRGWPMHYPGIHHYRYGGIASVSVTYEATKFVGPHKSRMRQYIVNAYSFGPNRHGS